AKSGFLISIPFLYFFTHSNLNSNEYFIKNPLFYFSRKRGSAQIQMFFIYIIKYNLIELINLIISNQLSA
ncbi:hypothetical protein, partial [Mesomycoplasma hyorhinis]|uniref:hypothetical protein n=1 Tax=Mesomycoplasma hyorhinis TaxID=2100 RepID=UPI001C05770A